MSEPLDWIGEQFPPHGALAAEGFGKLLGRPSLDALTVLVRETAQNSWDARLPRASVHFSIDGYALDGSQFAALYNEVFWNQPPAGLALGETLEADELSVLVISDRHTKGLGGPTRADKPTDGPTDYIDLLMNVGVASGHEFGGGTYGFGKTISYLVSRARTILVHTRTANGLPKPETRLIGSAIGDQFVDRKSRYTGRHWWARNRDSVPEPLTGRAAESLARSVGFPGFADDETGTSVMIIDPDFGDRTPAEGMRFIADAITWNLWPKMVRTSGRQPMHFAASWGGEPVVVSPPEDFPPLHGFAQALEALRDHDGPFQRDDGLEVIEISAQRPNRRLGRLALYTFVAKPRPIRPAPSEEAEEDIEPTSACAFNGPAHHVALLRIPELVVSYLPGPELPDSGIEWGGVFVCDKDLDAAFAASEPPTHDDWQPLLVPEKRDRRVVNIALRGIRAAAQNRVLLASGRAKAGSTSVARVADALAGLIQGVPGTGLGRTPQPGAGGKPPVARPEIVNAVSGPELHGGERHAKLSFALHNPSAEGVQLRIRVGVATNDGSGIEGDAPAGSPVPILVAVAAGDTERPVLLQPDGPEVEISVVPEPVTHWAVLATSPDDVMVAFDVEARIVKA